MRRQFLRFASSFYFANRNDIKVAVYYVLHYVLSLNVVVFRYDEIRSRMSQFLAKLVML